MTSYKDYIATLPLVEALWWFIENTPDEPAERSELFFDLRERYRADQDDRPKVGRA
ncbi:MULTISPECIES: hypothetical protein [Mesorhizobium]|uniref:hypothetical protein n=1 Tax=Mesorhizobium TaxID=68287 RepID=UPI00145A01CF|nr:MULTISPECIES: hypothetical protein [Mesorhizobium]